MRVHSLVHGNRVKEATVISRKMSIKSRNDSDKTPTMASVRAAFNYPRGVYFCLATEFAERFSFHGMQTILILYLVNVHGLSSSTAKLIYHFFAFTVFFSPLFGAIADGFFGRYRVILLGSCLYCLGHLLLSTGAMPFLGLGLMKALDYIGLFIVALGAGGIKPCVTAFAADQFPPQMENERTQYFSFFYFVVNFGPSLSRFITPIFRRQPCLGQDTCYPLAFGVPAIFMFLATLVFCAGTRFYQKASVKDNVVGRMGKCMFYAIKRKFQSDERKKHWLDYASPKFDHSLITDIRAWIDIAILYVPVIFVFSLFMQTGSTWVLQGNKMNGRIGGFTILPDQMGALNQILIIIFIPLFEAFIYPSFVKFGMLVRPLRRMVWGGVLIVISFLLAGLLQVAIDKTSIDMPLHGQVRVTAINFLHCDVDFLDQFTVPAYTTKTGDISNFGDFEKLNFEKSSQAYFAILSNRTSNSCVNIFPYDLTKTMDGKTRIYVIFEPNSALGANFTVLVAQGENVKGTVKYEEFPIAIPKLDVQPSLYGSHRYDIILEHCNDSNCSKQHLLQFQAVPGAAHALIVNESHAKMDEIIPANTVSILWQVPQYVIIAISEILFSITGLSFSYSQASPRMKTAVLALWGLAIAFGNLIDVGLSGSGVFENKPTLEFFTYGLVVGVVMILFVILAWRYKDKTNA